MKKILLGLVSCLVASTAHAVPTGCFITDYSSYCYGGSFSASDCDQWNMTSYNFGSYIYSMCSYVNSAEASNSYLTNEINSCNSDFNVVVNQRDAAASARDSYLGQLNSCIASGNSTEANRQLWVAYANKRDALVKRLYRACGAKCKKVK
jgi:hypothetical protein